MNNENIKMDELEELRETFQLMDEKLDSQEIVTPEQIRAATMEKVGLLETELKSTLISGIPIAFLIFIAFIYINEGLSKTALLTAGIYCLVSVLIGVFLLRKITRKDFVKLDLNSLLTRERIYRRTFLITLAMSDIFIVVFTFVFLGVATGIMFSIILFGISIPMLYSTFVKAYKEGLQGKIDVEPSPARRFGQTVGIIVLSIIELIILAATVLYTIAIFKTYPETGLTWIGVTMPLTLACAAVGLAFAIESSVKGERFRHRTVMLVIFAITIVSFLADYIVMGINDGKLFDPKSLSIFAITIYMFFILFRNTKRK